VPGDTDEYRAQFLTQRSGQIGFGYGHSILNNLSVGISLKMVSGNGDIAEKTFSELNDVKEELNEQSRSYSFEETKPTMDLGFSYEPVSNLRMSLVGRNITSPELDVGDYNLNRETNIRGGMVYKPFNWWQLSFDADLLQAGSVLGLDKDSAVKRQAYREVGAGSQFILYDNPFFGLDVSTGFIDNVATNRSEATITGGISTRIGLLRLNLNGGVNSNFITSEGSFGQVSLSIGG
jgi:hypothetical protein